MRPSGATSAKAPRRARDGVAAVRLRQLDVAQTSRSLLEQRQELRIGADADTAPIVVGRRTR